MAIKHVKKLIEDGDIVFMTYVGFISQTLLTGMVEALEQEKDIGDIPRKMSHSIFTVLIEMTQNIMKYSKNDFQQENSFKSNGLILVGKHDNDNFYVHSQNIVTEEDSKKIKQRLADIDLLGEVEIKLRYRQLRRNATHSHNHGAGIGFYEIAKCSDEIQYKFKKISKNKYNFYLTVNIK